LGVGCLGVGGGVGGVVGGVGGFFLCGWGVWGGVCDAITVKGVPGREVGEKEIVVQEDRVRPGEKSSGG